MVFPKDKLMYDFGDTLFKNNVYHYFQKGFSNFIFGTTFFRNIRK